MKEEILSVAPGYQDGNAICFGVNMTWEDEVSTRGGDVYGQRMGKMILSDADSTQSLPIGVYVKEGISAAITPMTKGEVTNNGNLVNFGVWCSLTNEVETGANPYFSNLSVTRDPSSGICSSDQYFWPGDYSTLSFLAVAPYASGLVPDNDVMPTSFTYSVPAEAVDQKDVMIATPGQFDGDYGQPVQLNFQHILSAVNVKVGDIPGGGTINSISIKNLHNTGKYTVSSGSWAITSQNPTASYSVDFGENDKYVVNESISSGTQINAANATFMLLPQTLSDATLIEVNFTHALTNNTVTLSGKLVDLTTAWAKNATYNYLINITPDYILEITTENVPTADCHYDIREITISDEQNVGWTLTSDVDWVKFRLKPADYATNANYAAYKDYWIESHSVRTVEIEYNQATKERNTVKDETVTHAISNTLKGSGNATIQVYFYENVSTDSGDDRVANLALSDNNGNAKDNLSLHQYNPLWSNTGLAYERIEESTGTFPWGFASSRTVTYTYPDFPTPAWVRDWGWIGAIIYMWFGDWFRQDYNATRSDAYTTFVNTYYDTQSNEETGFITMTGSADSKWTATLNYANLNSINAQGTGYNNTITVLSYTGGSTTGSDAETWLINNNLTSSGGSSSTDNTTLAQTAVYQAVKKNAWVSSTIVTTTKVISENGQASTETSTVNEVTLASSGVQWFLPSSSEVATLLQTACDNDTSNNDTALSGTYWSSTSSSGTNSVSYTAAGATSVTSRTNTYKVRAARSLN